MAAEANALAVAKQQAKTPVGSTLNSSEWADMPLALRERAQFSSEIEKLRFLQRIQDRTEQALKLLRRPGEGADGGPGAYQTREKFVAEMMKLGRDEGLDLRNSDATAGRYGTMQDPTSAQRLKLIYNQQTESALEYARWRAEQDPDVLAAYPAQEFVRIRAVKKPRQNWPQRWADAADRCGWVGVSREAFKTGRMVALKNSQVWRYLSRFGTPYPPFDYGSGRGLRDIGRKSAEQLGLLKPGDPPPVGVVEDFNAELQASIADLSPRYRQLLKDTFPGRIEFDGDTARWLPAPEPAMAPPESIPAPEPEVTPAVQPEPVPIPARDQMSQDMFNHDYASVTAQGNLMSRSPEELDALARLTGAPDGADITLYSGGPNKVRATIRHPEYDGPSIRTINEANGSIHNDILRLKDTAPDGMGTHIFASQVADSVAHGLREIDNYAASGSGWNGYYTWPRLGYDAPLSPDEIIRLPQEFSAAQTVLDVMATPAGRDWWRRNGSGRDMVFDLAPGSRSRKVLEDYLNEKSIVL